MGWDLEQRGKALFALSYKQSASINKRRQRLNLPFVAIKEIKWVL